MNVHVISNFIIAIKFKRDKEKKLNEEWYKNDRKKGGKMPWKKTTHHWNWPPVWQSTFRDTLSETEKVRNNVLKTK